MGEGRLKFHDSPNYSARLQSSGKRAWFPLGSPNKKTAAAKAAEIYAFIQAHGWDAALERYKPKKEEETSVDTVTVGMLIETASKLSSARRQSLEAYTKALRRIVSEVKGIKADGKFNARGGGTSEWQKRVDAVKLADLTPATILAWKNQRLRNADSDPLAKGRAAVTVNSLIRNAKALYGKKILRFIEQELSLPRPLPFDGLDKEKSPSLRYVSKIDAFAILARAKDELAESDPEAFKAIILALVCGLRRSEIDHLLWRNFDFQRRVLRIESTEYHMLKSVDSAGEIDLNEETALLFQGFRAKAAKAEFVIESPHPPRTQTKARCYRCDAVFKRALKWLRAQGVESNKPLHTMRKEIGSIIASEHGIFEASRYLRHSDIRITSAIYADKKKTVTPKALEGLFSGPTGSNTIEMRAEEASIVTDNQKIAAL
jgi:integrase